jgi:DNA polymerase III delta subunit
MILLYHGPDAWRRRSALRAREAAFRAKYPDAPRATFDAENPKEWEALQSFVAAPPLWGRALWASVQHMSEREPKEAESLLRLAEEEKSIVLALEGEDKPTAKWKKRLSGKTTEEKSFEILEGASYRSYLKDEAVREAIAIDDAALDLLAASYPKDTWGAMMELQTLKSLGRAVTKKDIESRVSEKGTASFFALLFGLRSQKSGDRLRAYALALQSGEPVEKLFHIMAYQKGNAARYAAYDVAVKSGTLGYEEAFLDALL